MHVDMLREVLSPGVQHRGDAELGAEVAGVAREALQRGGRGAEQQRVEPARVDAHEGVEGVRQREDDVEVLDRQQRAC